MEAEEILDLGNGVGFRVSFRRAVQSAAAARFDAVRKRRVWEDGMIERGTSYLDIDEARAAAERLAEERG